MTTTKHFILVYVGKRKEIGYLKTSNFKKRPYKAKVRYVFDIKLIEVYIGNIETEINEVIQHTIGGKAYLNSTTTPERFAAEWDILDRRILIEKVGHVL